MPKAYLIQVIWRFTEFFYNGSLNIPKIKETLEEKLGYQAKADHSPYLEEFKKEMKDTSIFYYYGHGDYEYIYSKDMPTKFLGFELYVNNDLTTIKSDDLKNITPKRLVFLNCCWSGLRTPFNNFTNINSVSKNVKNFFNKFNTDIYLGWNRSTAYTDTHNFAIAFFEKLNEKTETGEPISVYRAYKETIDDVLGEFDENYFQKYSCFLNKSKVNKDIYFLDMDLEK